MSLENIEILIICVYILLIIAFPIIGYTLGSIRIALKEIKEKEREQ